MNVDVVMSQIIVADADRAVTFYTTLFGRGPDAKPMDKLHEWHFERAGAVQVYEEPERAGASGVTLHLVDLDAACAALDRAGIDHEPVVDATFVRVVQLEDPDRNRVVLTGAKSR